MDAGCETTEDPRQRNREAYTPLLRVRGVAPGDKLLGKLQDRGRMAEKRRISNSPLANLRYRTRKEYRMTKGGSCSIETADILCEYLGLELVSKKKTKVKNK
ncbi:hypothetical protein ES707_22810 [subsurface metagenome]